MTPYIFNFSASMCTLFIRFLKGYIMLRISHAASSILFLFKKDERYFLQELTKFILTKNSYNFLNACLYCVSANMCCDFLYD